MPTVLVAGASGLVGGSALEAFARAGWDLIAVSRRPPEPVGGAAVRHVALDLTDSAACRAAVTCFSDVTHVVYAALFEKPGLIAGWRERDQMDTNQVMLRNLMTPLVEIAKGLKHVTLLQGTKAYGAHIHLKVPLPARERAPRDDHENFYWLQEDDLRAMAEANGFAWTIFRPQIIVGAAWGAAMNDSSHQQQAFAHVSERRRQTAEVGPAAERLLLACNGSKPASIAKRQKNAI